MKRKTFLIASATTAVVLAGGVAAWATIGGSEFFGESVEDFYRGKTIELKIGYSDGGGYDSYGRLLARHIGRHIPGNPTVVPLNMPGDGSLKLTNHLYNEAPQDGTVFGIIGRGIAMEPLLGGEATNFVPTKFNWLGSLNSEVSICVSWHTSPVRRWEDLFVHDLVVGGTGSGSDTDTMPTVLRNLFGARLQLESGYDGGSDIIRAMERGEVEGRCGWSWSSVTSRNAHLIENGSLNILVQMALQKHPDLPDVPLIMDLARTDEDRDVLLLLFARQAMGRPFVVPPRVPADRVAALRRAFNETVRDPRFLADARGAGLEIQVAESEVIAELLDHVYRMSTPALIARATTATTK